MLRRDKAGYEMQLQDCMKCGRTPPMEAKKCHPCNSSMLSQKFCTGHFRIAEFFAILEKEELWPSVEPFEATSVSDLVFRLACTKDDCKHSCAAGSRCPLSIALERLSARAYQIKESITGLCLIRVPRREWKEDQACKCTEVKAKSQAAAVG
jgi:ribosomal protein L40E